MDLREFIFKRVKKTINIKNANGVGENPFVSGAEGRYEWNDRYMNMAKAVRNWQLAFLSLVIVTVILALIVAKTANSSKVQPYIIETNDGIPYTVKKGRATDTNDKKIVNYAINQFILNSKSVVADAKAEKTLLDKVYAYSAGNTLKFLQDFYSKSNPFVLAAKYTVSIKIISSMPIGDNTWQVIWEENKHDVISNNVLESSHWTANISYKFGEIQQKTINDNPFGIYITDIHWSENRG